MTIKETLAQASECLSSANISSARLDAELLLAHVLKKNRVFLLTHGEKPLAPSRLKTYRALIGKRFKHYPLAYLTGHKGFYGLDFLVTPDVLVPRPESELIIDLVKGMDTTDALLVDVGTGSGCLPITLAPYFKKVIALDISGKALLVAGKNARKHARKNIRFIESDLLTKLPKLSDVPKLIITANLPYVTAAEIKAEPSIQKEPRLALYGGPDGLTLYRRLAIQLSELKKQYPLLPITLICEINPRQKNGLKKVWSKNKIDFKKDVAGKTRLGVATI